MYSLTAIPEPTLLFGYEQSIEDPRDGLNLFGPLDRGAQHGVRYGVIGTADGIERFHRWVQQIQGPLVTNPPSRLRPPFPGFEAAFGIPWKPIPALKVTLEASDILKAVHLDDKHQRVYKAVDLYVDRIKRAKREEEAAIDIWFAIAPDEVYKYCRPNSSVEPELRVPADRPMSPSVARSYLSIPSLFEEDNNAAIPYQFEVNFHNQLKARLLSLGIPTQVIRESTLAPDDFLDQFGRRKRNVDEPSALAWNLASAIYYKIGGRPWKISAIRDGVCYIGLVFKQDPNNDDARYSCCAAQMFLDDGDGIVFKGAVGPWLTSGTKGDYHLSRKAASELIDVATTAYRDKKGTPPKELFIHGKIRFENDEWGGFCSAVSPLTKLVGVRLRPHSDFRLYSRGKRPIMRGLAYIRDEHTAYLWTKGYIPRLQTYPGMEVPAPLLIDVCKGQVDIVTVIRDILALTKLNYNACIYGDGEPVTIKFADAVGEILTAGPLSGQPPLPFKFYI